MVWGSLRRQGKHKTSFDRSGKRPTNTAASRSTCTYSCFSSLRTSFLYFTCTSGLFRNEGVFAFWKGLAFAYGRELSYTSVKLGAYAPVRDALGAGGEAPFYLKFVAGAITGGVGSAIGNPFDV